MGWLDKRLSQINSQRFPDGDVGLAKLITNALVDSGYQRFQVALTNSFEQELRWVIWAKNEQQIRDAKPEYELRITRLPLGWFFAEKTVNALGQGQMRGDGILYEERDDVDSATAAAITAWLATPTHLRNQVFPESAA
jgi:hypothetical protein